MGNNGSDNAAVLFVDDEAYVLNSVERLFLDSSMKILRASSADEALDKFTKEEIAVIVSDNQMPGIKGTELLSRVRDISPDTLRILMTAHADLSVAVDAINKGEVFRFITKPWDDDALLRAVQEAVSRYQIVLSLKKQDEAKLLSIAQTIELKDPYTRGHCERVATYALIIANALGLPEKTLKDLKYGCWLHDCGKIGVPEHILNKKGTLDPKEFEIIKKHPRWGADVARQAQLPETVVEIILYHHERYDGTGYPLGIKGPDIPLEARIVTVADVYDALTSDRPYRDRFSEEKVIAIMQSMKTIIFEPRLVDIFLTCRPTP
ncbi:MAG: HD domain-containing protein [Nitrospiraceae bacterium]|nr:MAG: HD domain-containing protein [Nitrospiraceae bacterium]